MRCAVNVGALQDYVDRAGPEADEVPQRSRTWMQNGMTRRQLARRLLGAARTDAAAHGMGWVTVAYRHSKLGAQLVMAGHVAYSREYAVDAATDPFSLPRTLRAIALRGVGHDIHPNIRSIAKKGGTWPPSCRRSQSALDPATLALFAPCL